MAKSGRIFCWGPIRGIVKTRWGGPPRRELIVHTTPGMQVSMLPKENTMTTLNSILAGKKFEVVLTDKEINDVAELVSRSTKCENFEQMLGKLVHDAIANAMYRSERNKKVYQQNKFADLTIAEQKAKLDKLEADRARLEALVAKATEQK